MAYIFCESCGIGFHSNVYTCSQCGQPVTRAFAPRLRAERHGRVRVALEQPPEDIESEVREAIYGWRSGAVALRGGPTRHASAAAASAEEGDQGPTAPMASR